MPVFQTLSDGQLLIVRPLVLFGETCIRYNPEQSFDTEDHISHHLAALSVKGWQCLPNQETWTLRRRPPKGLADCMLLPV